jgi:hypothetical protein
MTPAYWKAWRERYALALVEYPELDRQTARKARRPSTGSVGKRARKAVQSERTV